MSLIIHNNILYLKTLKIYCNIFAHLILHGDASGAWRASSRLHLTLARCDTEAVSLSLRVCVCVCRSRALSRLHRNPPLSLFLFSIFMFIYLSYDIYLLSLSLSFSIIDIYYIGLYTGPYISRFEMGFEWVLIYMQRKGERKI